MGTLSAEIRPIRILVVEDENLIALNLKECLESLGYQVLAIANTADRAIAQATKLQPDLVLMDIRLKGERDGIYAADYIWATLQIPVIYITGHSDTATLERAKLTAPFGYLLKPFKERSLYITIETALQRYEREKFLLTVFRGMGDGVIVADAQGQVQFLNTMAERLTGWSQAEAKGRTLFEVFHLVNIDGPQEALDDLVALALCQETPIYLDQPFVLVSKDNYVIPIADSLVAIRDTQNRPTGIVIVFRDVTQQLMAHETERAQERNRQLAIQMEEMEQINQLKEDFLATTSHEMRTPLANIKMAIRLLELSLDRQGLLDPTVATPLQPIARYLQILNHECDQELRLVNDLLELRSLDGNPVPLELSTVQMDVWLPHLLEGFQDRMNHQDQTLTIEVAPGLAPVMTEVQSLTRIVSELAQNACKYTPSGGCVGVSVRAAIAPTDTALIVIEVRNSGIEISPDQLPRIFDPFYRIATHDPWKHGGTGLGLALVKKLVARLGGTITVTSVNGWTSFELRLPQAEPESDDLSA